MKNCLLARPRTTVGVPLWFYHIVGTSRNPHFVSFFLGYRAAKVRSFPAFCGGMSCAGSGIVCFIRSGMEKKIACNGYDKNENCHANARVNTFFDTYSPPFAEIWLEWKKIVLKAEIRKILPARE